MGISRRFLLLQTLSLLAACAAGREEQPTSMGKLVVGVVAFGGEGRSLEHYQRFIQYLETKLKTLIELEPAYNEVQAVEQIQRHAWSLVFAPPGLAAIALSQAQYSPILPLQRGNNLSALLVVLKDSPIENLAQVTGQRLALGQVGSATNYYVPLYDLYGTSPAEIRLAPTPKTALEWLAKGEVAVAAVSRDEFDRYRGELKPAEFQILHASSRIPPGSILISPEVERNQQKLIQQALRDVVPAIAEDVGYIPNAQPPDYTTLIAFIQKVKPIEAHVKEQPANLFGSR